MTQRAQRIIDAIPVGLCKTLCDTCTDRCRWSTMLPPTKNIISAAIREAVQCVLPDEIGGVQTAWKQEMLCIATELEAL